MPSILDRFSLRDRVALVTGGSRGIGRAISIALAEAGAAVGVSSRKAEACEAVAAEITKNGGQALSVPGHAGRAEDIGRTVTTMMERFGRIDILVNNAATNPVFAPITDFTEEQFEKTNNLNVRGPLLFTQQICRAWMSEHGGSIINVASVGGIKGDPFLGIYGATKAALISLTKSLARELGPSGVRVNAIAPGLIRTDFARVLVETPEIHDRAVASTALGRIGEPEEMAGAVVWLASDAASFVTGSVVVLDGGALA